MIMGLSSEPSIKLIKEMENEKLYVENFLNLEIENYRKYIH
jgi:hypothetical protein